MIQFDYSPKIERKRQWRYRRGPGILFWLFVLMCFVWAAFIAWVFA